LKEGITAPAGEILYRPKEVNPNLTQNLQVGGDLNIWSTQNFLPPPALLAEYDKIIPNLGRDIIDEWKKEGEHRRSIEIETR
ncbi:MAG: DUF2335 domain-containing protein, partial [Alphaproteobacteria bacterium]|nr:DUF2335 domain-containing protein [Alphaproteobacteria bacterium]